MPQQPAVEVIVDRPKEELDRLDSYQEVYDSIVRLSRGAILDCTSGNFQDDIVACDLSSARQGRGLTNADQTPYAVPMRLSSLMRMGMLPTNGMTFIDNAKELKTIGMRGCTVVKPMRAKTTI